MKYLDRKFISQFLTNNTDKKIIFNSEALLIPTGIPRCSLIDFKNNFYNFLQITLTI